MKPFQPVFWPVPVFYRDELKPTKRGKRAASNYGLWIIAKKGTPSYVIEQEKYESRYWVMHFWRLIDFFWFYKSAWIGKISGHLMLYQIERMTIAAAHLASVECQSRAQEIRAKCLMGLDKTDPEAYMLTAFLWDDLGKHYAANYARTIHKATNYKFFQAAGWDEERVYQEIVRHL